MRVFPGRLHLLYGILLLCLALSGAACTSTPSSPASPSLAATATPTTSTATVDPFGPEQLAAYQAEGLFICDFEANDIAIWQGYSQATETRVPPGQEPPEGYLPVSAWHAKYTDRWVKPTEGFVRDTRIFKLGTSSGWWTHTTENTRIVTTQIPHDWSGYSYLSFWLYAAEANGAAIELVVYSESDATPQDDYYKKEIRIDWTGWRLLEIPFSEFRAVRSPVGWHKVDYIKLASSGWGHDPLPTTDLYFDGMKLSNQRMGPMLAVHLPETPMHPNLLLNTEELTALREKIQRVPWAAEAFRRLKSNADQWAARTEIQVPETGGGFYHAADPTEYQITEAHYRHSEAARDLALAFHLTQDRKYVANAKAILLAYADRYLTYEIHDKEGRTGAQASAGGRATPQGINEARWIIPLAWAYDLLYHELTPAEREAIEERLLRPAAQIIMDNNEGRHNHQTWYNAGVGVVGFALNDPEMVWYALEKDDSGFRYQMRQSVTPEGMWYEGSMHYQFFVLQALTPLVEAAYHAGIDLYSQEPAYKKLFDFPLEYADAGWRLPVFNDGRVVVLTDPDRATYYEVALYRFGDPRYAWVLSATSRSDLNSLIYGVDPLPEPPPRDWRSRFFPETHLAVLRSGAQDRQLQVVMNTLGYQGGHSHPDQLGLVFHGLGEVLAPDAGSIKYRVPAHLEYFKQSVAHNVLVVDRRSQERTPPPDLEVFVAGQTLQAVRAVTAQAYPGVALQRTLLLNDNYLVDIFQADSTSPHIYDWVYHNLGRLVEADGQPAPTAEPPGTDNGYQYFQEIRTVDGWTGAWWQATWTLDPNRHVRATLASAPGDRYFLGEGPIAADKDDEIADYTVPVLIARREAPSTRFVALLEPYRTEPAVHELAPLTLLDRDGAPLTLASGLALAIHRDGGRDLLVLDDAGQDKQIDDLRTDARQLWATYDATAGLQALYLGMAHAAAGTGWTLRLEGLSTAPRPEDINVLLEFVAPDQMVVRNAGMRSVGLELEEWPSAQGQVWELDRDGRRAEEVRPTRIDNGFLRLVLAPQTDYLVTR